MDDEKQLLPVGAVLPELFAALRSAGGAVLAAAPGAGKTTLVPGACLDEPEFASGRILLLEPRRVAARAAARRIASLLGEPVGRRVGYIVRGDSRYTKETRILVVTEGVLIRRIQEDPMLEDTALVIFDEFHERSLDADLGLALVLDLRNALRPELKVLVMSATLETEAVARLLGDVPVIEAPGRQFPVEQRWSAAGTLDRFHPAPAVARACAGLYREKAGDMLVFLPGMAEIEATRALLETMLPEEALLLPLHGSLSPAEQDCALQPAPPGRRKVVLATNIAESSLTIDGVTLVVDSGLERRLRYSPAAGISFLELGRISQASAAQRSGRAGRTAPGTALRLWSELEHRSLEVRTRPEILDADLAGFALELAAWGASPADLAWLDPPPEAGFAAARKLLTELGALDREGALTPRGRKLASLPVHPRLGMMLLRAAELGLAPLGAELAALLEERDVRRSFSGADLRERVERMRRHPGEFRNQLVIKRQLLSLLHEKEAQIPVEKCGLLTAFAYPGRIGRARCRHSAGYLLSGGSGARLEEEDALCREEFLAVARLDGAAGREAVIRLAAPLDEADLELLFSDGLTTCVTVEFDPERERAVAREELRFGALLLRSTPVEPPPGALPRAVLEAALGRKLELPPPEQKAARRLLERVRYAAKLEPDRYPDWSEEEFRRLLPELAAPYFPEMRSFSDLGRADFFTALRAELGAERLWELDRDYPESFTSPAGASHKIDYSGAVPTLPVRVQEMYGVKVHPMLGRSRQPLRVELLSPAGRPVQVTTDLPGFWRGNWPLVRKEMKGRYPKHFWPENPAEALPTTRTRMKMEQSGG